MVNGEEKEDVEELPYKVKILRTDCTRIEVHSN